MKKLLVYFSLLIFHFSFCHAQDTIVTRKGQRIPARVISVTNQVVYSTPDNIQVSVKTSDIDHIHYKDGSVYTAKHDSANKPTFYINAAGGIAIPVFNSYGYESSANNASFGQPGPSFWATFGVNLYHGWGVAATYANISVKCHASEFLSEENGSYFGLINFTNSVTSSGNYSFSNSLYMVGVTKTNNYKFGDLGVRLMLGDFNTSIPNMQGIANNLWNPIFGNPGTYYIYTYHNPQNNFAFDFGIFGDIKIISHLFLHAEFDMLFSKLTDTGNYSFADISTGKSFETGQYNNTSLSSADLANFSIGLTYQF